jgi:hypothetical protein
MDYKSPLVYYLGGENIRISFSDPVIGLICQAFFHPSRTEESECYEICFTEMDKNSLDEGLSPEKHISDYSGTEALTQIVLNEGFHLFFLPERKKVFSYYPKDIFEKNFNKSSFYDLVYENTFNDEILPPNSSGVIATIYWLLECIGLFRLHAAHVEYKGTDIIFAGKGSVGKTTSALNVALNGGKIFCDDQLFFRKKGDGSIEVYPLNKKIAVTENTMKMFPDLLAFRDPTHKRLHKYHITLEEISSTSKYRTGTPEFIIFPYISENTDSPARAEAMSSYEGFIYFLKGEILYPTISSENRDTQLDLLEILTGQARIFALYNSQDMEENLTLFRETISLKSIPKNTVS